MGNESGTITWPALLLTFMVSTMALISLYQAKKTSLELRRMTKHVLCLKESLQGLETYTWRMGKFNRAIQVQHYAYLFAIAIGRPVMANIARTGKKMAQKAQLAFHVAHLKNLATFPHCSLLHKSQMRHLIPYKNRLGIISQNSRRLDGTLKLQRKWKKAWNFKLLDKHYASLSRVQLEDRFATAQYKGKKFFRISKEDLTREVLSNWKPSLGF